MKHDPAPNVVLQGSALRAWSLNLINVATPMRHRSRFLMARAHRAAERVNDLITISSFLHYDNVRLLTSRPSPLRKVV
jgi:hypothetical protein